MTGNSEIDRFCKEVAASQSFRDELKAVGADNEAIVRFANAKGYTFSMADVSALAASAELSDEQLEQVAGGFVLSIGGRSDTFLGGSSGFLGGLAGFGTSGFISKGTGY